MIDDRSLLDCFADLPDAVVLALVLIIGAYAISELLWRMG